MKQVKFFYLLLLLFLAFSSCKENKNKRAFYIWKTQLKTDTADLQFFSRNKIEKLYIRFFDISYRPAEGAYPKAPLKAESKLPDSFEIVPVIFIENNSLKKIREDSIQSLAEKIFRKTKDIFRFEFKREDFAEIQLDCDWSKSTRKKFFKLTKNLKSVSGKQISVTLRLHQLKYPEQTGIPPADRAVLMYYNMGKLKDRNEYNSVLNNKIGAQYLRPAKKYPLKTSLALPVFSWTVLFRYGKFKGLLNNIHQKNIDSLAFLEKKSDRSYIVRRDTVYNNVYFRYGDKLRLEKVSIAALDTAKKLCRKHTAGEIVVFSYSPKNNFLHHEDSLNRIFNNP